MLLSILDAVSRWAIPVLLFAVPLWGILRKVPVYEAFVEGAEEGFSVGVKIIPFLVGMLVAISVFRGNCLLYYESDNYNMSLLSRQYAGVFRGHHASDGSRLSPHILMANGPDAPLP